MKKLSITKLLSFSILSFSAVGILAMEDDAKIAGEQAAQQRPPFTRCCRPAKNARIIEENDNAVIVDLQSSDSDAGEDNAPVIEPDYQVTVGQEFTIAHEEDGTTTHRFDQRYSSNNLFKLVRDYCTHARSGSKTHYFVFKALCQGNGVLQIIGETNQPEQMWIQSYQVAVE